MSEKSEPAFPSCRSKTGDWRTDCFMGMAIRDYFAAHALQGMLAYSNPSNADGDWHTNASIGVVVTEAYAYADAMMKARNQ